MDSFVRKWPSYLSVAAILFAWKYLSDHGGYNDFLLPDPVDVLERLWQDLASGAFFRNGGISLYRALAGFVLGGVAGILLGLLMALHPAARWFVSPLISLGLPLPKVALIPVFVVWFGFFDLSKILLVAFSSVFIVSLTTLDATTRTQRNMEWSALSLGASRLQVMRVIIFYQALPGIFTALQIALPICLIVVFVAEMVMGGQGLGAVLIKNARFMDTTGVFAGIVEIALIGGIVISAMAFLRKRCLYWIT